ncbi:MAG: hypothetical protein AAFR27_03195 [Pseudomonadota bacterium]
MIDYALHHCECALRIVRGDPSALEDMDISTDGFWRSFQAIIVALPATFFTRVIFGQDLISEGVVGSVFSLVGSQAIIDIILWILPIIALAMALPPLGLGKNYTGLIIARNWLSAVVAYIVAAIALVYMLAPVEASSFVALLFLAIIMVSIWMFLRVTIAALPQNRSIAYAIVIVEVIVIFTLADMLTGLFGLRPV